MSGKLINMGKDIDESSNVIGNMKLRKSNNKKIILMLVIILLIIIIGFIVYKILK